MLCSILPKNEPRNFNICPKVCSFYVILISFKIVVKVSSSRNGFCGHRFPPKNEWKNSFSLLCDLFSFVFWKKSTIPKKHFEINWPLVHVEIKTKVSWCYIENYHNFERNEDHATVFLKWMDFSLSGQKFFAHFLEEWKTPKKTFLN